MSRTSNDQQDSFKEMWGFPNEVLRTVSGAVRYDVRPIPGCFKSGRQRFEATFVSADHKKVLARRAAMELVSKRTGAVYHVCKRHEETKGENALRALTSAGFGIDDVVRAD